MFSPVARDRNKHKHIAGRDVGMDFLGGRTMINSELLPTGTILDNRYEIVAEIGRGGMSVVYKAKDRRVGNRLVAVKALLPEFEEDRHTHVLKNIAPYLHHPRCIAPTDHGKYISIGKEPVEISYVVMPLITGATDLQKRISGGVKLQLPFVVKILRGILELLVSMQEVRDGSACIIHRDLKPENVFVTDSGEVYLFDWGIAMSLNTDKTPSGPRLTMDGMAIGTAEYMSPNQVQGRPGTTRCDLYSLAIMVFEMLVGYLPIQKQGKRGEVDPMGMATGHYHGEARLAVMAHRKEFGYLFKVIGRAVCMDYEDAEAMMRDLDRACLMEGSTETTYGGIDVSALSPTLPALWWKTDSHPLGADGKEIKLEVTGITPPSSVEQKSSLDDPLSSGSIQILDTGSTPTITASERVASEWLNLSSGKKAATVALFVGLVLVAVLLLTGVGLMLSDQNQRVTVDTAAQDVKTEMPDAGTTLATADDTLSILDIASGAKSSPDGDDTALEVDPVEPDLVPNKDAGEHKDNRRKPFVKRPPEKDRDKKDDKRPNTGLLGKGKKDDKSPPPKKPNTGLLGKDK